MEHRVQWRCRVEIPRHRSTRRGAALVARRAPGSGETGWDKHVKERQGDSREICFDRARSESARSMRIIVRALSASSGPSARPATSSTTTRRTPTASAPQNSRPCFTLHMPLRGGNRENGASKLFPTTYSGFPPLGGGYAGG